MSARTNARSIWVAVSAWLIAVSLLPTHACAQESQPVAVTVSNFARAETDRYLSNVVTRNGIGQLRHFRQMTPITAQPVVRMNRDTLYSSGVFDLDAGPVTITLPEAGERFMSVQAINEDHYTVGVYYEPGAHTFTREQVGTRYLLLGARTFADPNNTADMEAAHALQDAIHISQASPGSFEIPAWDETSRAHVRTLLNALLGSAGDDAGDYFGAREDVDHVLHLLGTAGFWGGNPRSDAVYLYRFPSLNDGATVYRLIVRDVPVDAFWSASVYNADGYFEQNDRNAYSLNSVTAQRDRRGAVTVQFGGCTDATLNCLPVMPGWNYTVRLYRPRAEILSGAWHFPEATPVPARRAAERRP